MTIPQWRLGNVISAAKKAVGNQAVYHKLEFADR
jgi:hypothetical protein